MTDITTWDCSSSSDEEEIVETVSGENSRTTTGHNLLTPRSDNSPPTETSKTLLNRYEFSNANQWQELDKQPQMKAFLAYREGDQKKTLQSVGPFSRDKTGDILELISKQFKIKLNQIKVEYEMQKQDGSVVRMALEYNKNKEIFHNSQHMFYCTANDLSTIIVSKQKEEVRSKRPVEDLFTLFKKHRTVYRDMYKKFMHDHIILSYLSKLRYVRILLGSSSCMNLVNPGYFFCHVPSCPSPEVELRSFNNISSIIDHWKKHLQGSSKKYPEDKSCLVLLRRNDYIKDLVNTYTDENIDEVISEMEEKSNSSLKSLAIHDLMINMCLVFKDSKFPGRDRLVNEDVLRRLLNGEECALLEIPEAKTIDMFFSKRSKKTCHANVA